MQGAQAQEHHGALIGPSRRFCPQPARLPAQPIDNHLLENGYASRGDSVKTRRVSFTISFARVHFHDGNSSGNIETTQSSCLSPLMCSSSHMQVLPRIRHEWATQGEVCRRPPYRAPFGIGFWPGPHIGRLEGPSFWTPFWNVGGTILERLRGPILETIAAPTFEPFWPHVVA